ncbi:TonB-dependent receptor, partial [Pseudanabaenaceae cyanobacterium LEGE 13415]|nr:TonB-dependent receptor [Pseudanabaenaceae cyanobacterium LEGE 13415]
TNTEFLPGYTTFDIRTRIPLSRQLILNAGIENVFDRRYELFPGFPDGGRTFQAGLNYQF